jgi:GT2 family glycosyltransferase
VNPIALVLSAFVFAVAAAFYLLVQRRTTRPDDHQTNDSGLRREARSVRYSTLSIAPDRADDHSRPAANDQRRTVNDGKTTGPQDQRPPDRKTSDHPGPTNSDQPAVAAQAADGAAPARPRGSSPQCDASAGGHPATTEDLFDFDALVDDAVRQTGGRAAQPSVVAPTGDSAGPTTAGPTTNDHETNNHPRPTTNNQQRTTISVVVTSSNTRQLLRRLLDTLPAAMRPGPLALETIVVDNASRDESADMVQQRFPHVRLLRNARDRGYAAAVNRGLREATGSVLVVASADVVFPPGSLWTLAQMAMGDERVGALSPQLVHPDGRWQRTNGVDVHPLGALVDLVFPRRRFAAARARRIPRLLVRDPRNLLDVRYVDGAALVMRRSVLDRVGMFDERFFFYDEDLDFCARMRKAGYRVAIARDCRVVRDRTASTSGRPGPEQMKQLVESELFYVKLQRGDRAAECVRGLRRLRCRVRRLALQAAGVVAPSVRPRAALEREWEQLWKTCRPKAQDSTPEGG